MLSSLVQIGGRRTLESTGDLMQTTRWDNVRPRFATVYVENKCHLSCDHCYETEETHPHAARLSVADYDKLFDELASLGVLYLTLTGGEIFLRGDLFDLVSLGRKKRFAVRLYTSGTLIDEARADRIRELKVSEVQVSLYSVDAAVHDRFVGQDGAHAKTVRALRLLRERGVRTVAKTPVMTINVDALEQLAAFVEEEGADFRVDPLVHPRTNGDRHPLRYLVPPEELRRKLLSHPRLHPVFDGRDVERICRGDALRADGDAMCAAARDVVSIAADGGVLACASFPVAAGNVREHSLVDIWRRARLLDQVRATTFGDMTSCGTCSVKSSCDPCMAHALIEHGDHRQCNTASLQLATALREHAERRARRDGQARRAEEERASLPIVGGRCAPRPPRHGCGCGG